jgi:hypothetical protein
MRDIKENNPIPVDIPEYKTPTSANTYQYKLTRKSKD